MEAHRIVPEVCILGIENPLFELVAKTWGEELMLIASDDDSLRDPVVAALSACFGKVWGDGHIGDHLARKGMMSVRSGRAELANIQGLNRIGLDCHVTPFRESDDYRGLVGSTTAWHQTLLAMTSRTLEVSNARDLGLAFARLWRTPERRRGYVMEKKKYSGIAVWKISCRMPRVEE